MTDIQYLGSECRVRLLTTGGDHLVATVASDAAGVLTVGARTTARWRSDAVYEVRETGRAVDRSETAAVDAAVEHLDLQHVAT